MKTREKKTIIINMIILLMIILVSCGNTTSESSIKTFKPGECISTQFDEDRAEVYSYFSIDYSGAESGYIGIKETNSADKLVFQLTHDDANYNYWFDSDNTTLIIPLSEDGSYTFTVLKNTEGDKYVQIYSSTKDITLSDEFQPFIRSNSMVSYSKDDKCIIEADKLAAESEDDLDYIKKVYKYIENNLSYDKDFADTDPDMYYPNLDNVLSSGKGICFDYAALAAGMLRSQGIPTKLVTGYVNMDGDIYHAWNMVYIKNKGWITIEVSASADKWNLVDITLDDTGDSSSIESGSYTPRYVY